MKKRRGTSDFFVVVNCFDNNIDFNKGLYKYGDLLANYGHCNISIKDYAYFLFCIDNPSKKLVTKIKNASTHSLKGGCFSAIIDINEKIVCYDILVDGFARANYKKRREFLDLIIFGKDM